MIKQIINTTTTKANALVQQDFDDAVIAAAKAEETIEGILASYKEVACMFCKGWGHRAKGCRTLFNINKAVMGAPSLKNAWGKKKATFLSETYKKSNIKGIVGRKRFVKMM